MVNGAEKETSRLEQCSRESEQVIIPLMTSM